MERTWLKVPVANARTRTRGPIKMYWLPYEGKKLNVCSFNPGRRYLTAPFCLVQLWLRRNPAISPCCVCRVMGWRLIALISSVYVCIRSRSAVYLTVVATRLPLAQVNKHTSYVVGGLKKTIFPTFFWRRNLMRLVFRLTLTLRHLLLLFFYFYFLTTVRGCYNKTVCTECMAGRCF